MTIVEQKQEKQILTTDDLIELLIHGQWIHVQGHHSLERCEQSGAHPDEEKGIIQGYAFIESALELAPGQRIEIVYQEMFSYDETNPDETLETTTNAPKGGWFWVLKGVDIVDQGEYVSPMIINGIIETYATAKFVTIDYNWIIR